MSTASCVAYLNSATSSVIYRGQWKTNSVYSFPRITQHPSMHHWLIGRMSSSSRLLNLTPNGIKELAGRSARGARATQAPKKQCSVNNIIQPWHIISPWWSLDRHVFLWRLWFRDCGAQEMWADPSCSIDCDASSDRPFSSFSLSLIYIHSWGVFNICLADCSHSCWYAWVVITM